jgi:hypothetical protein
MQTLNEKQVVIQNTKTGKQVIVAKHFFEANKNQIAFRDFEIAITPGQPGESASEEPAKKTRKAKGESE